MYLYSIATQLSSSWRYSTWTRNRYLPWNDTLLGWPFWSYIYRRNS